MGLGSAQCLIKCFNPDFGLSNPRMGLGSTWPWAAHGSHTFPLQICPLPGAAGDKPWHFRAEQLEGTERITGASQKQLRAFSDLLPFTWLPVSLKKVYFFFFFPSLVFSPAIPMRHSFLWVIHTIKKLLFGSKFCSHAWNQHFSVRDRKWAEFVGDSLFTILTWDVFLPLTLREKKILQ